MWRPTCTSTALRGSSIITKSESAGRPTSTLSVVNFRDILMLCKAMHPFSCVQQMPGALHSTDRRRKSCSDDLLSRIFMQQTAEAHLRMRRAPC